MSLQRVEVASLISKISGHSSAGNNYHVTCVDPFDDMPRLRLSLRELVAGFGEINY
jgi:hypothetical protein